jgi:hypothetical protein
MAATFQNSGQVLSIGIYFSLMVIGLSGKLPEAMQSGLIAHGVPVAAAIRVAHISPVATLFAALLGANAVTAHLPPAVLHSLSHAQYAKISSRSFFPHLITPAFSGALTLALRFSVVAFIITAAASWLRGSTPRWEEPAGASPPLELDVASQAAIISR